MMSGTNFEGLPIFYDGTEERILGTLAPPPGLRLMTAGPIQLIPESQWVEFDYRKQPNPIKIKDQNGKGACVGHATATAMEWARFLAGATHEELSAWFLYSILCGGWDRGASIPEALDLARTGTCRNDLVPYKTINPGSLSAEAHRDSANYRIELGGATPTFEEMMSETQRRRPGNFSIGVGNGFNDLDGDGVPPSTGNLNHSVCYGLAAIRGKNGEWLIGGQNSWSPKWGNNGFFNIRKSTIRPSNDSWSIAAVYDTPNDPTNPPAAP